MKFFKKKNSTLYNVTIRLLVFNGILMIRELIG